MTPVLLDTNVLSEVTRPAPDPRVIARLSAADGIAAISAVTAHELRHGALRLPAGRRRDALVSFVRTATARYPVLPYDDQAARWHARERARLEGRGIQVGAADAQIAATAATRNLVLVTRNIRDFAVFDDLEIDDWWQ